MQQSFYYTVLIALLLTVAHKCWSSATAAENADDCPMARFENLLCNNTQLTDDQCGKIMANCGCDEQKNFDKILMECIPKTSLTDRDRLTAWCATTVRQCTVKKSTELKKQAMANKDNAEMKAQMKKKMDERLVCMKNILGN